MIDASAAWPLQLRPVQQQERQLPLPRGLGTTALVMAGYWLSLRLLAVLTTGVWVAAGMAIGLSGTEAIKSLGSNPSLFLVFPSLLTLALTLAGTWLAGRWATPAGAQGPAGLSLLHWQPWRQWVPRAAAGCCAAVLVRAAALAFAAGAEPPAGHSAQHVAANRAAYGWAALAYGVLTPMHEEMVYSGFLLQSLCQRLPRPLALLATSLVFAAAHGGSGGSFLAGACASLLFGAVFLWAGTLWAPILVHGFSNVLDLLAVPAAVPAHLAGVVCALAFLAVLLISG